eukprot:8697930-Ditylum_brightwellii.AAC.1
MEAIAQVIKGQEIQDGDAVYSLVKSLLKEDALQVFQNKEASQEIKDGLAFTKCLMAVTKHVFPKKAYKTHKKYIRNIRKPLRLGSCKWISRMIKLNGYLVHFPVPDGVTATKISCTEFVDILEDGIPYQWKLEFEKESFDSSSSMLKEFLDVCVLLEEAELQKLLRKKIACARKEHGNNRKETCQDKPKSHHERRHSLEKCHQGKRKKKYCNYHGLCYHGMGKCNFVQSHRKHVQPMHHIMEQQRLKQVWLVKDTKRRAKKCGLTGKE